MVRWMVDRLSVRRPVRGADARGVTGGARQARPAVVRAANIGNSFTFGVRNAHP